MNKDLSLLEALGYSISVIGNFPSKNFIDPDSGNVLTTIELYKILEGTYNKYNAFNLKLPELHYSGLNSDSYNEHRVDEATRATTTRRSVTRPIRGGGALYTVRGGGVTHTGATPQSPDWRALEPRLNAEEEQPNTLNGWTAVPHNPFFDQPPVEWTNEVHNIERVPAPIYNRIVREALEARINEERPQTEATTATMMHRHPF